MAVNPLGPDLIIFIVYTVMENGSDAKLFSEHPIKELARAYMQFYLQQKNIRYKNGSEHHTNLFRQPGNVLRCHGTQALLAMTSLPRGGIQNCTTRANLWHPNGNCEVYSERLKFKDPPNQMETFELLPAGENLFE